MARARKPIPDYLECPFTVVIDSNESLPYHLQGIYRRHSSGVRLPLVVPTERLALWAMNQREVTVNKGKKSESFRIGYADYSIKGHESKIQVERKTLEDLFSTIGGRHSRFEAEIKRLHEDCLAAYVVIEADLPQISVFNTDASPWQVREEERGSGIGNDGDGIDLLAEYGTGSAATSSVMPDDDLSFNVDARPRFGKTSPAVVLGTISSWKLKYPNVHWEFCTNRSMAEMWTFQLLCEFWDKWTEGFYEDRLNQYAKGTV